MSPIRLIVPTCVVLLLSSASAFAQDSSSSATESNRPPPASTEGDASGDADDGAGGWRLGFAGMGGPVFAGDASGYAGGLEFRLGWQFSDMVGAYVQPMFFVGGAEAFDEWDAFGMGGVGLLADLKLITILYIGLGPELVYGGVAGGNGAGASTFFSIASRAGLRLGPLTAGIEFRTIFTPGDPMLVPMLAIGFDTF